MNVTVIGCGRLGAPYAASLAELGHQVLGLDSDPDTVAHLTAGRAPFDEPGLGDAIGRHAAAGRLRFTGSYREAVDFADLHFLCVPTPQQAGALDADLTAIEAAVLALATHATKDTVIVGKSSVPVGTAAVLGTAARQVAVPGVTVTVAWSPDFLRESTSMADANRPTRIIVGLPDKAEHAEQVLRQAWAGWTGTGVPLIVTDLPTAELAKSAANAFLATKVSFINAFAAVCEATGADVQALARSMAHDPRIGSAMLSPGLGFGGSCIPKDIRALLARAEELGVSDVGLLREIDAVNIRRRRRVLALARDMLGGSLAGARITVWGAAFKPGTDDTRDSPALAVAADLDQAGANVTVSDPKALPSVRHLHPALRTEPDPLTAASGAELLLHLTEWPLYREQDPCRVRELAAVPRVIDARGTLDAERWRTAGWTIATLGGTSGAVLDAAPARP